MLKFLVPLIVLAVTISGHPISKSDSDSSSVDNTRQAKQIFFDPNLQVILYRRWIRPRPHFPAADRNDVVPAKRPGNRPVFNPHPPNHHSHKHPDYSSHIFGKNFVYPDYPDFPEFFADYWVKVFPYSYQMDL